MIRVRVDQSGDYSTIYIGVHSAWNPRRESEMDLPKVILSYSYLRLLLLLTFIYCGSTQASESISAFKRI